MPSAPPFEAASQPLFEVQFRAITESLAGNGIVDSGDLEVTATATDLEIQVDVGAYQYLVDEYSIGTAETHTLSAGDGTYDRWVTVYLDTSVPETGIREGNAEANPSPPDVQNDEVPLAFIYVPSGATDAPDSNIFNWRAEAGNRAGRIRYDDSTGQFGESTVDAALDELQEAAQLSAHPLANGDLADSTFDVAAPQTVGTATYGTVYITQVPDTETLSVTRAGLVLDDGQAAPTDLDLAIVTMDNAGGLTKQTTVIDGDGTVQANATGTPLASYENTSGGAQTVAVVVDNGQFNAGSGSSQDVAVDVKGEVA